jgi:hypothetical protein
MPRLPGSGRALKAGKGRAFPWKPTVIYALLVAAAAGGVAAWDHAYEARRAALLRPPPPPVLAKTLIEDVIGPGTVHNVAVDEKAGTADLVVEDVLVKPGQSRAEREKNLVSEGSLAIQLLRGQMRTLKAVTLHLVKGGKPLATVRVDAGHPSPVTEFAPNFTSP